MIKKTGLGKGIEALFTDAEFNDIESIKENIKKEEKTNNDKKEEINIQLELPISEKQKIKVENETKKEESQRLNEKRKIEEQEQEIKNIQLSLIEPNLKQARKFFDEQKLKELSESIKLFGILQPIIVEEKEGYYSIIAGERRWRAAKIAGLKTIPAIVKQADLEQTKKISIIENIQRENLNPVEKAKGYKSIIDQFNLNPTELANKIGKSPSSIHEALSILNLDNRVIELLETENIPESFCKTLLKIEDGDLQYQIALYVIEDGLTIDEAKKRLKIRNSKSGKQKVIFDPIYKDIETQFTRYFGNKTKLKVSQKNQNKGQIIINYTSMEDLERMLDMLNGV